MKYCLRGPIVTASLDGFVADEADGYASTGRDGNPLLSLILRLLREQPMGISEYELLKKIEVDGVHFSLAAADASFVLFQKHFLIMNALYRLQDTLWREEQVLLTISPLRIALETANLVSSTDLVPNADHALRTYYLDWQQFLATDSAAVTELIANFWIRYAVCDQRAEALATLQLNTAADWGAIKRQYRRLAAATHPDRGGDAAQFLTIRAAYETLTLLMR